MRNDQLAKKLKELRTAHGYKQEDIASVLGIVRQTYSHYETGKRSPDSATLYKLAGFYNISIEDLLHLTISLDRNVYYDAPNPTPSSADLDEYLEFFNKPENKKKYHDFDNLEKKLLYYFRKLSSVDKEEIIDIVKLKVNKKKN